MTINKVTTTDFQTEESRIESGTGGETLNATVSCRVVLANANVHARGSKHGGATC